MSMLLTVLRNADVHAPEPLGRQDLLLGGGYVLAMAARLDVPAGTLEVDAEGAIVCPGFVDSLVHLSGGGGEGGFGTRTPALADARDAFRAGITTAIGALGTDDVTRSLADLLACARALALQGLTAPVLTGSYRVPVCTLTGSIRSDLVLIPDMIGVGEVAIADHRGSHPCPDELARIGADARVGGMLAGKAGRVLIHVGDAEEGLAILHETTRRHPLPASQWHPTHLNRHSGLLAQAPAWVGVGGSVDLTASTTPELVAAGDIPAARALASLLAQGMPASRITMSSDGHASLPDFDEDGVLRGLSVAPLGSLMLAVREAVNTHGIPLATVLETVTRTPARIWGLPDKGQVKVGAAADLLVLAPGTLALRATFAGGRLFRFAD